MFGIERVDPPVIDTNYLIYLSHGFSPCYHYLLVTRGGIDRVLYAFPPASGDLPQLLLTTFAKACPGSSFLYAPRFASESSLPLCGISPTIVGESSSRVRFYCNFVCFLLVTRGGICGPPLPALRPVRIFQPYDQRAISGQEAPAFQPSFLCTIRALPRPQKSCRRHISFTAFSPCSLLPAYSLKNVRPKFLVHHQGLEPGTP